MRLLHSFCGRNKKTCIALQANNCTASWLNKIHVKFLGTKKNAEKIVRPHSLFMRCFDHVRIKSRNFSTFERLWRCKLLHGPCIAVADQVNNGESSVTIFGYDNSYFIATPCRLD